MSDVEPTVVTAITSPPREHELAVALAQLCATDDEPLAEIGRAIRSAAESLAWQIDDGWYYARGVPVSKSYRLGNINAPLLMGTTL